MGYRSEGNDKRGKRYSMVEEVFTVCVRSGYLHSGARFMSTSVNSLPGLGSFEK
jgi:hypothetical protein